MKAIVNHQIKRLEFWSQSVPWYPEPPGLVWQSHADCCSIICLLQESAHSFESGFRLGGSKVHTNSAMRPIQKSEAPRLLFASFYDTYGNGFTLRSHIYPLRNRMFDFVVHMGFAIELSFMIQTKCILTTSRLYKTVSIKPKLELERLRTVAHMPQITHVLLQHYMRKASKESTNTH